jgi:hypothetical protein
MIYGITYDGGNMSKSAKLCADSMMFNGIHKATLFKEDDISGEFKVFNKQILSSQRGCGYWLWKPYLIYRSMCLLADGHVLIYADAGVEFVCSVDEIIGRMDQNSFLFTNTHPNHHWTKRYTLDTICPGWNHNRDKDTPWPQVQASVIFLKVCEETRRFVNEWLLWCQMPDIINDQPSPGGEMAYFQDHRHDQSVLTLMAYKYGYKLHWWPTEYAQHIRVEGDTYPVLFNHHRKRDFGKGNGQPEWPQS